MYISFISMQNYYMDRKASPLWNKKINQWYDAIRYLGWMMKVV